MKYRLFQLALLLTSAFIPFYGQVAPSAPEGFTIQRSACATDCPIYSLHIDRSGIVTYDGKGYVKVFGQKTWSIPTQTAENLLDRLEAADLLPGDRPGRFLTDSGACASMKMEKPSTLSIDTERHDSTLIPGCYSPSLATIIHDAEASTGVSIYASGQDPEREAAIRSVLDTQVEAWNRGDIEGFMRGYWMSKDLTFFSGATETHGWTETLERYRKSYKATGKQMGKLNFGELRIELLSPDAAFVRGSWKLTMSDGKTPHGLFTLIFRKTPDGWRIIHDSTGAA